MRGDGAPISRLGGGSSPQALRDLVSSASSMLDGAWALFEDLASNGSAWHVGSSRSALNIIAVVFGVWIPHGRDLGVKRFGLLSKGHASMALYTWLAASKMIPVEELKSYLRLGSRLQAHPEAFKVPGIIVSTGSLGQGLSIANGIALASRIDGIPREIAVILGDGELDEGQVWEAAATASSKGLSNVTAIVDRNMTQHTGRTEDVKAKEPLDDRWRSFGWHVITVRNTFDEIVAALEEASAVDRPVAVIVRPRS
ncbi:MAG: thiamine pyrophosphate-dependent enzyme [Desulfurococcales archaeon]|nr:thiamine pyrophosphate-dependent enzyme [Desulfurococcales archaeon]MCE4605654.1 thiamine pyrophosphate-dependent enzyme [Desulfurococcales archaeon]